MPTISVSSAVSFDVSWEEEKDEAVIQKQIIESFRKAIYDEVKSSSYYERYYLHGNDSVDSSALNSMFYKALEEGQKEYLDYKAQDPEYKDGAESFIMQNLEEQFESENWFEDNAHEARSEAFGSSFTSDVAQAVIEALEEAGLPEEAIPDEDDLENIADEESIQAIWDEDTSSVKDVLKRADDPVMTYAPMPNSEYFDDNLVQFNDVTSIPSKVIPDECFVAFLKMVNVAPASYANLVKEHEGVDVQDDPDYGEMWQELLAKDPVTDLGMNAKRKPALSNDGLIELMENICSRHGLPTVAIKIPHETLLKMDGSQQLLVKSGGQVGLHDFINGAGFIVDSEGPLVLETEPAFWRPAEGANKRGSYDLNDVYGMVSSAFDAEVALVEPKQEKNLSLSLSL